MPCRHKLLAGGKHLPQHAHEGAVLQRSSDPLLVAELLVDSLVGAVGALLNAHVDAVARGQCLLEADAHTQADDGGERAVRDGGCDLDEDGADGGQRRHGGQDVDVGQIDDGERAQRERVLGVGDGGDEVVDFLLVDVLDAVVVILRVACRGRVVERVAQVRVARDEVCLLYTSPSPRD